MAPHIQIIPGSFSPKRFYFQLRGALVVVGYEVSITQLLSAGKLDGRPPATMEEDAEHIHKETEKLVAQDKEVVLVMHSYGAIPGTQSVKGLSKMERQSSGKAGGVVRLVYLAGVVPQLGQALNEYMVLDIEKYKDMNFVKVEGDYMSHEPEMSAKFTFSDLPPDEGLKWAKQMIPHSSVSFDGKLSYPGYQNVPVSYIVCTQDLCVPTEVQRSMIKYIERQIAGKVHVRELASGHFPMMSRPAETAKLIADAVEQGNSSLSRL